MKQRSRIYYSEKDKALMWDRSKKGDSLHDIGRLFDRGDSSIQNIIQGAGGIRPRNRKRSVVSLTLAKRELISRGLAMGQSLRTVATQIQRSPSTVCREVKRNEGRDCYRAAAADEMAWQRTLRPKACKLAGELKLIRVISEKLKCEWSPEQISGWLKREYPHDKSYHVSHEIIYKSLFIQTKERAVGVFEKP
ncbi:MAG: hypothetical protein ACI92E_002821 [Oceanicoccus sp.]|jgi:hypothetical protein